MKPIKLRILLLTVLILVFATALQAVVYGQSESVVPKHAQALAELDGHFTFMIANDLGRNGYYDQKPVAEMMGVVAAIADPEFVAMIGDAHHFQGVRSVHDPLWNTNFEWIYKHPELMLAWHPVLGNHEYEGNTQAVLDYAAISRRWEMPARYYAITEEVTDDVDALLLFIDTVPLIDKYRKSHDEHSDAAKQSMERQLAWIDSTLAVSNAKWKIVMGHHPIYAGTTKSESERTDLQKRLQPILDKYGVDFMVSGHIHTFQHIQVTNSKIDYFVNTSASQTRKVIKIDGTQFGSPDSGFSLCTAKENELIMTFVNKEGEIIYQYSRKE